MWACAKSCDARLLSQLLDVAGDDLPLYHMDEVGSKYCKLSTSAKVLITTSG